MPGQKAFLGEDARMRLPNPDEALNLAHAHHGADDPELAGTADQKLCLRIVKDFDKVRARSGTPEVPYLESVRTIVRTYARAITRRKAEYRNKLRFAEEIRGERERRINDGRISSQGLGVLWKFVGPAILGLTGFLVARIIGDFVPADVSQNTGSTLPSIILGLAFALVGRWVGLWLYDRRRAQIVREYEIRKSLATDEYELGKLTEFTLARQRLCEAWEQYTGERYPKTISYQMVMKGDIETRKRAEEHLMLHNRSDFDRMQDFLKDMSKAASKSLRRNRSPAN